MTNPHESRIFLKKPYFLIVAAFLPPKPERYHPSTRNEILKSINQGKWKDKNQPQKCLKKSLSSKDRDSPAVKEALKITTNTKKIEKRLIDYFEEEFPTRKKNMVTQSNPKASKPITQDYESEEKFSISDSRVSHLLPTYYQDMIVRVYSKKPELVSGFSLQNVIYQTFPYLSAPPIKYILCMYVGVISEALRIFN